MGKARRRADERRTEKHLEQPPGHGWLRQAPLGAISVSCFWLFASGARDSAARSASIKQAIAVCSSWRRSASSAAATARDGAAGQPVTFLEFELSAPCPRAMQDQKKRDRNGRGERGQALHEQWAILLIAHAYSQLKRMLN